MWSLSNLPVGRQLLPEVPRTEPGQDHLKCWEPYSLPAYQWTRSSSYFIGYQIQGGTVWVWTRDPEVSSLSPAPSTVLRVSNPRPRYVNSQLSFFVCNSKPIAFPWHAWKLQASGPITRTSFQSSRSYRARCCKQKGKCMPAERHEFTGYWPVLFSMRNRLFVSEMGNFRSSAPAFNSGIVLKFVKHGYDSCLHNHDSPRRQQSWTAHVIASAKGNKKN